MTYELDQFQLLLATKAQEGLYLDFKRGDALAANNDAPKALVKDCTGFANANGGTIVYGIAEDEVDGNNVAGSVSPVTSNLGKDWISEVLRNRTSPPLTRFEVTEIALPKDAGRVVVVEIEPSSTAHQSLFDHKYYQRAGAVTAPMVDFQIRDVMNRRSRPEVGIDLKMDVDVTLPDFHRYFLNVTITNIGSVTLEKWWFELDIPTQVLRDTRNLSFNLMTTSVGYSQVVRQTTDKQHRQIARVAFGDPHWTGNSQILHPGQSLEFEGINNYPQLCIEINHAIWHLLEQVNRSIPWRLFMPNNKPLEGEWAFNDWCRF